MGVAVGPLLHDAAQIDTLEGRGTINVDVTTQGATMAQKTDFSELKASFNVKNGIAYNNDLSMKSPLLRAGGKGDIDIGNDRLNYVLKATVVATSRGQGGREAADLRGLTVPVKLTGALASPQYSLRFRKHGDRRGETAAAGSDTETRDRTDTRTDAARRKRGR